ncbi:MAG: class I SAM-dependent methyltransferase [Thermodesulfobacteriota bacterium]
MDRDKMAAHYHVDDLSRKVFDAIVEEKGGLENLTADDLLAVDGFHIRGRRATVALSEMLSVQAADRVLDVGAGAGGTARYLSAQYGCRVVGMDLTPAYVKLAAELSSCVSLSEKTAFACGNAVELPFKGESFDRVWTEHIQMNIRDKDRYVSELKRVLKPSGQIALHEVFTGPNGDPFLPAPWASDPATSFMVDADEMKQIFTAAGLRVLDWQDVTETSRRWFEKMRAKQSEKTPSPLGLHLLMGSNAGEKIANMGKSLAEGHVRVIMAVFEKPG